MDGRDRTDTDRSAVEVLEKVAPAAREPREVLLPVPPPAQAPAATARGAAFLALVTGMFFLSGATGLTYEVVWFKRFTHVWGSSALAMTFVIGAFLLGLGIGARVLGRLADRTSRPLFWYGLCEIGIAALALLVPLEIAALQGVTFPDLLVAEPVPRGLTRFFLTFIVLGPPCVLMGGTLPLLVRQFAAPGSGLPTGRRDWTGWLYGVNTAGAAAGTFAAGFLVLPAIGLFATNLSTVALNLAIGVCALLVSRALGRVAPVASVATVPSTPVAAPRAPAPAREAHRAPSSAWFLTFAVVATGFSALALQIAWTRQLVLVLGGSTYAFSAVLFVVLVGIGLGSLVHHRMARGLEDPRAAIPALTLLLVASTWVGQWALPSLTGLVGVAGHANFRATTGGNALVCILTASAVQLVPAIVSGILFPLFVGLACRGGREEGRTVGRVYFLNTVGTILGSVGTGLLLVPLVHASGAVGVALALYCVSLLPLLPERRRGRAAVLALASVAGVVATFALAAREDPRVTNAGMYLYGYTPPEVTSEHRVLSYAEGTSCDVLVREMKSGTRTLSVNGKVDASDTGDMTMQLGLAYLPRILHPKGNRVFVIGYGSGVTAGAALTFADAQVTCCEIEPAVYEASEWFAGANHSPHRSSRFHIAFDDGRSFLQGSRDPWDLILSEPSNPWLAGVTNLFTREFYEVARARLAPGGVLAQWIQTYGFAPRDYALIARTITGVFPHHALIRISDGDTILVASDRPLIPDAASLRLAQTVVDSSPLARLDLERHFGTKDVRSLLLEHLLLDEHGVRRLVAADGGTAVNTDLNLRIEFDAPAGIFDRRVELKKVVGSIVSAADAGAQADWFARWKCGKEHLGALEPLASLLADHGQRDAQLDLARFGLTVDAGHARSLATTLILDPPTADLAFEEAARRVVEGSAEQSLLLGAALGEAKRYDRAAFVLERAAQAYPTSATVLANLARVYEHAGRHDEAVATVAKAEGLDGLSKFVREMAEKVRGAPPPPR